MKARHRKANQAVQRDATHQRQGWDQKQGHASLQEKFLPKSDGVPLPGYGTPKEKFCP